MLMILTLAVAAIGVGSAQAAVVYEAELIPENVQPSSGASAYGQATLIVNDAHTHIDLTLNFAGLDTPQVGANLIVATLDEVGTELLVLPMGNPLAQTYEYSATMADALESDELAIQVYSEAWPGGAIRGNFNFVTVRSEFSSWSQVKTLFD